MSKMACCRIPILSMEANKVPGVREAIEAAGATLLYLPPYSPDLNPIEQAFSKLKAHLCKAVEHTVPCLLRRIGRLLASFSPQECRNFLRHAGYVRRTSLHERCRGMSVSGHNNSASGSVRSTPTALLLKTMPMSVLTSPDPLRNAYGIVDFEILADPNQPRVRAVHIKTGDGGTFTFAIDPRTAMALASALIAAALAINPTLKEHLAERPQ